MAATAWGGRGDDFTHALLSQMQFCAHVRWATNSAAQFQAGCSPAPGHGLGVEDPWSTLHATFLTHWVLNCYYLILFTSPEVYNQSGLVSINCEQTEDCLNFCYTIKTKSQYNMPHCRDKTIKCRRKHSS